MSVFSISEVKQMLETARRGLLTLLDLGIEPEGSVIEQSVDHGVRILYEVLDQIQQRNGHLTDIQGPFYYPVEGIDIRDFPTSEGKPARKIMASRIAPENPLWEWVFSDHVLLPPQELISRTVLTELEYFHALKHSRPFEVSPFGCRTN